MRIIPLHLAVGGGRVKSHLKGLRWGYFPHMWLWGVGESCEGPKVGPHPIHVAVGGGAENSFEGPIMEPFPLCVAMEG